MAVVLAPYLAVGVWAMVGMLGSLFTSASLLLFSLNAEKSESAENGNPSEKVPNEEEDGLDTLASPEQESLLVGGDAATFPQASELFHESGERHFHDAIECCSETGEVAPPALGEPYEFLYLLPPREDVNDQRMTVVLDLDETLVRSCEEDDVPVHVEFAASVGLLERHEIRCGDPETGAEEKIVSFVRPGMKDFLEVVSQFAEVVLFTAGDPEYAGPLLEMLDPEGKYFTYSLYRDATVATPYHEHVKDLSMLGRDMGRTVLVDNNPYSFLLQPENGILCEGFYGDPSDRHLLEVTLPLLKLLACVQDVRPILRAR
ncbi:hypothetical protein BSKO_12962 [Bryopsis sp. KO-2023]|nr:hypothetical protein BSKO_12962 [Bryopsis sp. KO-2023]